MRELHLVLPAGHGRRAAVEQALRDAIREGRLRSGSQLPSSRVLAADLGVSRSTVVGAYEQLTAEGYLRSEHGRATSVADIVSPPEESGDDDLLGPVPEWDFRPGEPAAGSFPRQLWLQSTRRVMAEAGDEAFGLPDPRGRLELRATLAEHLRRTRSVVADPGGVFICGGFSSGLGFLADTFRRIGIRRVAVEQAMLPFHRAVLRLAGLDVVQVPVDAAGLDVEALDRTGAEAVVVTPANQYPFGVTLTSQRRAALVAWAEQRSAWIVEDDYDGEFRYDRRPIGALQGLAPARVVYAGTASKALTAGLRLGWLVVPEALRTDVVTAINVRAGVSAIEQLTLADFIACGHLDRHVRQMRRRYRGRRDDLIERLTLAAPQIEIHLPAAGLHVLVTLPPGVDEVDVIEPAAAAGIGLFGLQTHHRARSEQQAIVLGFSRPADHAWNAALDRLCAVLARHAAHPTGHTS